MAMLLRDRQRAGSADWLKLLGKWDETFRTHCKLAPQKGVHADDLDAETERPVRGPRGPATRRGAGGRARERGAIRSYCAQVFKQARLWERLQKSLPAATFTFSGDPMRIDYGYRRNGTRGFVQTVERFASAGRCEALAYTVERTATRWRAKPNLPR